MQHRKRRERAASVEMSDPAPSRLIPQTGLWHKTQRAAVAREVQGAHEAMEIRVQEYSNSSNHRSSQRLRSNKVCLQRQPLRSPR